MSLQVRFPPGEVCFHKQPLPHNREVFLTRNELSGRISAWSPQQSPNTLTPLPLKGNGFTLLNRVQDHTKQMQLFKQGYLSFQGGALELRAKGLGGGRNDELIALVCQMIAAEACASAQANGASFMIPIILYGNGSKTGGSLSALFSSVLEEMRGIVRAELQAHEFERIRSGISAVERHLDDYRSNRSKESLDQANTKIIDVLSLLMNPNIVPPRLALPILPVAGNLRIAILGTQMNEFQLNNVSTMISELERLRQHVRDGREDLIKWCRGRFSGKVFRRNIFMSGGGPWCYQFQGGGSYHFKEQSKAARALEEHKVKECNQFTKNYSTPIETVSRDEWLPLLLDLHEAQGTEPRMLPSARNKFGVVKRYY